MSTSTAQTRERVVAVMDTYRVEVERDGKFWLLRVPEIDRYTQARHLREVDEMARDLVAIMTGTAPGSFDLDVHLSLPHAAQEHLRRAAELRETSAKANAEAAQESRAAARALADLGLPVRDIGAAMGVFYQRASQLVNA